MVEESQSKLIPLPGRHGGIQLSANNRTISEQAPLRHRILQASFVLFVLLPTCFATIYYTFFASERFTASAGFAIRGIESGSTDFIGAMTGLSSGHSTSSDAYILLKYLGSLDMIERLEQDFPLREHYSDNSADWISRLGKNASTESVVEYWVHRVNTSYNNASGIFTFEVEAFDPQAAKQIASLVLSYCRDLLNELSSQARLDAQSFSRAEVERAEARLKTILEAIQHFRDAAKSLDPEGTARLQLELVGSLERQLADLRTRILALRSSLTDDAPSLRSLIRQAEALEHQILVQRTALTSQGANITSSGSLTSQLTIYETLEVERNFAQQYYASALSSLEKTRTDASRHQRYLAVYAHPAVPQQSAYPKRFLNVLLLFSGLALVWAISALVAYAVRDHLL